MYALDDLIGKDPRVVLRCLREDGPNGLTEGEKRWLTAQLIEQIKRGEDYDPHVERLANAAMLD